ncbi:MAG: methionine synthase [Mycobacteriales bacterium]
MTGPPALRVGAGVATGVGSLPGEDPAVAVRAAFDDYPQLPYLPELPARGPGADMLGRAAGMLVDISVDLQPSGWRLVGRPGIDERRARDLHSRDLEALGEHAPDYAGRLKLQIAGPYALAAGIELHRGDKAIADPGATRDIADSLAEGAARYVASVRERLPRADVVVQLDEPSLPAVLAGRVPTASGYDVLPAIEESDAAATMRRVMNRVRATPGVAGVAVHCCAAAAPIALLRIAGADGLGLDAHLLTGMDDPLGEAIEADMLLLLGVVSGAASELPEAPAVADSARLLWRRLGFDPVDLAGGVVLTPTCGHARSTPAYAAAAAGRLRAAGRLLVEEPEG